MEDRKEKNAPWLSVPQFGDWDQKGQVPDYSLDFSKIREMRKQNKRDVSRASLGNEEELISTNAHNGNSGHTVDHYQQEHSPAFFYAYVLAAQIRNSGSAYAQIYKTRRSIFSYFNCCVKA